MASSVLNSQHQNGISLVYGFKHYFNLVKTSRGPWTHVRGQVQDNSGERSGGPWTYLASIRFELRRPGENPKLNSDHLTPLRSRGRRYEEGWVRSKLIKIDGSGLSFKIRRCNQSNSGNECRPNHGRIEICYSKLAEIDEKIGFTTHWYIGQLEGKKLWLEADSSQGAKFIYWE